MFVVTLGTQASGSTWLFNVVRSLFEAAGRPACSLSSDGGVDALDRMPLDVGDVVLKSHAMDQRLLRLARLSGARMVVSTRDPLDSVVSQQERFGSTIQQASAEISRALATIASLPADMTVLRLAYEARFMQRAETVALIARFLALDVSDAAIQGIFESHLAENVRRQIAVMLEARPTDAERSHDPVTHWHPSHLGDGLTGKWRDRLGPAGQQIVAGCLSPLASAGSWRRQPLKWPADLFCNAGTAEQPAVRLRCDGPGDYLSYGPYLHLPRGHWRAVPDICVDDASDPRLEADVYLPWADCRAAHWSGAIPRDDGPQPSLHFAHHDHFQPVEVRLMNVDGSEGSVVFRGWDLHWMGSLN